MTCNDSNTNTITFDLADDGWRGVWAHFGTEEAASGADLDALMAQLDSWIRDSPMGSTPVLRAFGAPIRIQSSRVMRRRIEHEWIMERRAAEARSQGVRVARQSKQ